MKGGLKNKKGGFEKTQGVFENRRLSAVPLRSAPGSQRDKNVV